MRIKDLQVVPLKVETVAEEGRDAFPVPNGGSPDIKTFSHWSWDGKEVDFHAPLRRPAGINRHATRILLLNYIAMLEAAADFRLRVARGQREEFAEDVRLLQQTIERKRTEIQTLQVELGEARAREVRDNELLRDYADTVLRLALELKQLRRQRFPTGDTVNMVGDVNG